MIEHHKQSYIPREEFIPIINKIPEKNTVIIEDTNARDLLKTLSEPLRLQIIASLGEGEKCVCDLINKTGLAQSKISFHLKVLKLTGLISDRSSGRWVYYRLNSSSLNSLKDWINLLIVKSAKRISKECN